MRSADGDEYPERDLLWLGDVTPEGKPVVGEQYPLNDVGDRDGEQ